MKQADLFEQQPVTHYAPTATPGLPRFKRVAVCGVECNAYVYDGPHGCTKLEFVNCPRCLEEAKR